MVVDIVYDQKNIGGSSQRMKVAYSVFYLLNMVHHIADGANEDEIDYRWRSSQSSHQRVSCLSFSDHGYVDAKIGAALCHGGAFSYHIKIGSCVTDNWILAGACRSVLYGPAVA